MKYFERDCDNCNRNKSCGVYTAMDCSITSLFEPMVDERQECIDEIKRLRSYEKKYKSSFYNLELYEDLALEEMKARDLGITEEELSE